MSIVSNEFLARWRQEAAIYSGRSARRLQRPVTRAYIREGYLQRHPGTWDGPTVNVKVIGGDNDLPWMATYTPTSDWVELPNVISCDLANQLDQGVAIGTATIAIENVAFQERSGLGGALYHAIERGWLAPYRGSESAFTLPADVDQNEWYRKLDQKVQIKVWQGYGTDTIVPTFLGFIDDLDSVTSPDRITIKARDNGQIAADQEFFGWAKEVSMPDPVTFADRLKNEDEPDENTDGWILVDDARDMVGVILRWCGFKDFYTEIAGRLDGLRHYNRETYLMEAIAWCCEMSGYIFYVGDPTTDDDDMGYPVFQENRSLFDLPPEDVWEITENELLTGVQTNFTTVPLAHIIRVRGRSATKDEGGVVLSRNARHLMAVYRPPWVTETTPSGKRTARIYKHTIKDYWWVKKQAKLELAARLVALRQALESSTAIVQIPANPGIGLDHHVLLKDTGTGLNTRMWVNGRTSRFTGGREPTWTMSLSGALLDTPNIQAVRAEIEAL